MNCGETKMKTSQDSRIKLVCSVALTLVFSAYLSGVHAEDARQNIRKVNGSITVTESQMAANVSTVNGSVNLNDRANAADISTVNGGVRVSDNSSIRSAETVNGSIQVGEEVSVQQSLSTVNGGIRVRDGSEIGEDVSTVNGSIDIVAATVGGNIETSNGNIRIIDGAVVDGDIIIKKRSTRFWPFNWSWGNSRKQVVEVDADSRVNGTIHLYREVDLRIDDRAQVDNIEHHY